MLKDRILHILSPLLYRLLKRVLVQLKPLFLAEDDALRNQLTRKGFHPALCAHPSILYGLKAENTVTHVLCLSGKVAFLRKAIYLRLLNSDKGHTLMQQLDIPAYFGNGLEFWFEEYHTPYIPYSFPENNAAPKHIAVYTALTGNYDDVNEILYKEDGADYYLFTNNKSLTSSTWQIIYVDSELDNVLLSREIKMLPHKYLDAKYDASIYVDANAVIYSEISPLANFLTEKVVLAVTRHDERNKVREEIDAIAELKKVNLEAALEQYIRYVAEGFKDESGLTECGILVRNHHDVELQKVMEAWWKEFQNGIRRDQISLLPMIEALHFTRWQYMMGNIWHNQFCYIISHKK